MRDLINGIYLAAEMKSNERASNIISKSTAIETLKEATGELIDEFLNPNYVAQEDEWWKKKREMRR